MRPAATLSGLAIHPLQCQQLSADEAQLLHTLWLLQQRQLSYTHAHLQGWCCPAAARLAIGPASTFALLLQSQQMRLAFHERETIPSRQRAIPAIDRSVTEIAVAHVLH